MKAGEKRWEKERGAKERRELEEKRETKGFDNQIRGPS